MSDYSELDTMTIEQIQESLKFAQDSMKDIAASGMAFSPKVYRQQTLWAKACEKRLLEVRSLENAN